MKLDVDGIYTLWSTWSSSMLASVQATLVLCQWHRCSDTEFSPSNNPTCEGLNVSKHVFQLLSASLTLSHFSASLTGAMRSIALHTHLSRLFDMLNRDERVTVVILSHAPRLFRRSQFHNLYLLFSIIPILEQIWTLPNISPHSPFKFAFSGRDRICLAFMVSRNVPMAMLTVAVRHKYRAGFHQMNNVFSLLRGNCEASVYPEQTHH
jgi:hypothetical protein